MLGGDYQGLGIVRSLGRLGVPVCVVDDERSIARYSRFATWSRDADDLSDSHSLVESVFQATSNLGLEGAVLFPTRDDQVASISQHRDSLSTVVRVPTPAWDSIRWAWDKRKTCELAQTLGIPTPKTDWPLSEDELEMLDVEFPVAVKPAIKGRFMQVTHAKAWRADTWEELRTLYRKACAIIPAGEAMVQELIPGGGEHQYAYCAFFKNGEVILSMTARRRRQHPSEFGRASTFVETVDVDELEEYSLRLLRQIDYYGLAELEFKYDFRERSFKLLDVNARTWGYHTLGSGAGVDFSAALYRDQVGEDVEPCRARSGVTWLRSLTDVPTGIADIWGRRIRLRTYLQTVRSADVHAVWDRSDPRPWFAELGLLPYLIAKRGY